MLDEEKEMKLIRQDERDIGREEGLQEGIKKGIEKGVEQGLKQGIEQGLKQGKEDGINAFILDNLEEQVPEERIVEKLKKRFGLNEEECRRLIAFNGGKK